ncbi:MAG: LPS export ABC transporter periplasmic protein LptC [Desulfobulbus sp.]|nr:MAG: LPS export ABC transporter periplasmic protein LptC [Desulfobulbus sp.]
MLHNPRNLLWLLPLLVLMTSPLWSPTLIEFLQPRGGHGIPQINLDDEEQEQRFVMEAIAITMSTGGRVDWEITAEQAFTGKSDKEIGMAGVQATYTGTDQEKTLITSNQGTYQINDRHLTLVEDVVIDKPLSRQTLLTDLLHYYSDRRIVVCPGKVELRGPDFRIRAGSLEYDLTTEGYDFSDRVRVDLGI